MCGDLEEDHGELEDALYARFVGHARTLLKDAKKGPAQGLNASLDRLFADALTRAMRDQEGANDAERYQLLVAQPLVFARLAGFLAAHASLQDDPLRKVIEALMHGYAEAEAIEPYHGHDHDHHHHHDHHHSAGSP